MYVLTLNISLPSAEILSILLATLAPRFSPKYSVIYYHRSAFWGTYQNATAESYGMWRKTSNSACNWYINP